MTCMTCGDAQGTGGSGGQKLHSEVQGYSCKRGAGEQIPP